MGAFIGTMRSRTIGLIIGIDIAEFPPRIMTTLQPSLLNRGVGPLQAVLGLNGGNGHVGKCEEEMPGGTD
jgi:hypothetical protein